MQVDHCVCPNCSALWDFDEPEDVGVVTHCNLCAKDFRAGRWFGKHYPSLFGSFLRSPQCPQCQGTNSVRGKKVGYGFPDLYLRQCQGCWSVWAARK